jgi:hypothetical protein
MEKGVKAAFGYALHVRARLPPLELSAGWGTLDGGPVLRRRKDGDLKDHTSSQGPTRAKVIDEWEAYYRATGTAWSFTNEDDRFGHVKFHDCDKVETGGGHCGN